MEREAATHSLVHLTHVRNLHGILAEGCLRADNLVSRGSSLLVESADPAIKASRRATTVPLAPYGSVADYVPFYFASRSPMLYKIAKGGVPQYTEGQDRLLYAVTSVEAVAAAGLRWVFSDGNCASVVTEFFDDLDSRERGRLASHACPDVE